MERTYTLQDLLAALRRRRLLALVVAGAVLVVGVALALGVPSEYSAQSVVQIEPRRLGLDFFPAQNGTPFEDRMRTIKHGILARPVLERVIKETDFFPDLRDDMDEALRKMRRNVEVRLEGEVPAGAPALLFVVEVRGRDPEKVARAAELLPKYYGELTRQVLEAQARSLRETLDRQVDDMGKELSTQEKKLLAFKVDHTAELPELLEDNARAVGRAQSQIEMRLGAIADAQRRRGDVLSSIPEGPSGPGLAEAGLDAALRRLNAAEAAYGPDHPDVKRARREFQEALSQRDGAFEKFQKERVQAHLARIDDEVRAHEEQIASLRKEMTTYQKRIEAAPRWGQALANLSREYEVMRAKYASTLSRRADSAAAEQLLAADQPTMFRMVETPVTPRLPAAPDRPKLLWIAVLAAIAMGLGAAGIAEWLDASMRGPEDAATLGIPVLAAIPRIGRAS
ncbi:MULTISPECIES: lipopolysaccharide biosynthesis protein [Anaeromyxobacter]|uniref:lipopolysaccharide biosynthesis protein n=1 Tax=Anaeromyxobacter TaxID=161492 RepID=UPI001F580A4B|nr:MULTISPECIES: lipopolysaccharide biosynthesis protein [unclassified Anaeromyxobacter]